MKILVINAGSSSLKYQLIDMSNERLLAKGNCENIGLKESFIGYKKYDYVADENGEVKAIKHDAELKMYFPDHTKALETVISVLTSGDFKVIDSLKDISAFGHRVVHGKDYTEPTYVTDEVVKYLEANVDYAPLHNPSAIMGFKACMNLAPEIPNVAVFDTAFHSTMSPSASTYAIPHQLAEQFGIKKYGAHGTSHKFIMSEVERITGRKDLKIISCHLGSGASICAIKDGKCVDTSMGFTPLAGVVMGTRSGDIDPSIVGFLSEKLGITAPEVIKILNKKSGLLGLCDDSNSKNVDDGYEQGDPKYTLAFNTMVLSFVRYIGSYIAELGGVDVIVFTAGIGENSPLTREAVLNYFDYCGVSYSKEINNATRRKSNPVKISDENSKVEVYVIPTNEELLIARETVQIVNTMKK